MKSDSLPAAPWTGARDLSEMFINQALRTVPREGLVMAGEAPL